MEHYAHLVLAYGLTCWLPPFSKMDGRKRFLWALLANTCDLIDYYVLMPMISPTGLIPGLLPNTWPWRHRSFTHTIWFAIALSLLVRAFLPRWRDSLSFLALTLVSHYIPDLITAPMPLFMPLYPPLGPFLPLGHIVGHVALLVGAVLIVLKVRRDEKG